MPTSPTSTTPRQLHRPLQGRWIAGVCLGIARRYGLRPNIVRLAVLSCLLPGPQFVIYIVLWIFIPPEPSGTAGGGGTGPATAR
jgi:phage shock protein C